MTDSPLMPVAEALDRILHAFQPLAAESIPITESKGRVLAEDILSRFDLPPFDNSSMDGFALHAADRPATPDVAVNVTVVGDIPAGTQPLLTLQPGQAARIMTGAPLPAGADCVVPVEDTDFPYRESRTLPKMVKVRHFPLRASMSAEGAGYSCHSVLMEAGRLLLAADAALLAVAGVCRRFSASQAPSGNPIHRDDSTTRAPLSPGKIYESNSILISGLEPFRPRLFHSASRPTIPRSFRPNWIRRWQPKPFDPHHRRGRGGCVRLLKQVIEENGKNELWRVNLRRARVKRGLWTLPGDTRHWASR